MKPRFLNFLSDRKEVHFNKKVFVFSICLLISFFAWLQLNLSKKQIENIPIKVNFINLPKTRFGTSTITDTLFIEVEADGYDLIKYEMKKWDVDFKKLKKGKKPDTYYFVPGLYTKTIGKQMGENFKVLRVLTDTLQFHSYLR